MFLLILDHINIVLYYLSLILRVLNTIADYCIEHEFGVESLNYHQPVIAYEQFSRNGPRIFIERQ